MAPEPRHTNSSAHFPDDHDLLPDGTARDFVLDRLGRNVMSGNSE